MQVVVIAGVLAGEQHGVSDARRVGQGRHQVPLAWRGATLRPGHTRGADWLRGYRNPPVPGSPPIIAKPMPSQDVTIEPAA
ncbi:hypothetical protein MBOT_09240 [Mycobacterium botniense]|uniref:Uncharacterized protein n=1 Tax=Mycobacterium botniense TaxID=84962 RepID=A0A7I9XU80_9MYCO|nr:hypothetical protein MBOT_09240 [Mycobacterium botniense]